MSEPRTHLVDADIGSWVCRESVSYRQLTRAHYVQSVIAGGAVTYCGRVLPSRGLFRLMDIPTDKCRTCPDVPAGAGEDDGSTQEWGESGV